MLANLISKNNRTSKYKLFLDVIQPLESDKILDVGVNNLEYSPVDNYLEKHYPYSENITALSVDSNEEFMKRYPAVNSIVYDGYYFPFEDKCFDIGWSNAVIEHVGDTDRQVLFLKELNRTCKKVYFTTPNRYFPFEVHTRYPLIHWFPKRIFDWLLQFTPGKWASGEYMYLLSRKKLEKIVREAGIVNYKIYKNRFLGFTMDFSIIIQ